MIHDNREFFAAVDALIATLAQSGFGELSRSLHAAKTMSTVPGEIFGELQLELTKIASRLPATSEAARAIGPLLQYLGKLV